MCACHNNGDPGDNRLENLRWDTYSANALDKRKHGTVVRGSKAVHAKLHPEDVHDIRRRLAEGESLSSIGRLYDVSHVAVRLIRDRVNWAWLD